MKKSYKEEFDNIIRKMNLCYQIAEANGITKKLINISAKELSFYKYGYAEGIHEALKKLRLI